MSFGELLLVAIGLAMDALAASICQGITMSKWQYVKATTIAFLFGTFQALMPFVGYLLGIAFSNRVDAIDHWLIFIILGTIGLFMLKEARDGDYDTEIIIEEQVKWIDLLLLAMATSIDALAVGVGFAIVRVNIVPAITIIGIVTFLLCLLGVKIGSMFGDAYRKQAQIVGGIILFMIGTKVLIQHLFF